MTSNDDDLASALALSEAWEQGKQFGYALTVKRMTDGWIEADKFARQHGGNPYRPESQVLEPIDQSQISSPCKANLHGNCADCSCFCHPPLSALV